MAHDSALPGVLELLPHRYPFLLLDRVAVIEPGRKAQGSKVVTADEWFFGAPSIASHGAVPGTLSMPNVLIVEALAQLSAALLIGLQDAAEGPLVGYFMGIDRVRYRGAARPGDDVRLSVELIRFRRGTLRVHGEARVDGRQIVRAELTTVLRAAPSSAISA